ncbi:MAG: ATP-dependent zinc protease [Gammaproteobacteria bacterium]|nr:ATP-dependent zinc protease [Gammaproteobacteria bacterium]
MTIVRVLLLWILIAVSAVNAEKLIIGPTALVVIQEASISFNARVDTGAGTTSIHAKNIRIANGMVDYTIINQSGTEARLSSRVVREGVVKNAEVRETRVFVYLNIQHQGQTRQTLVNLNDRSKSSYKLLLGRNWLTGSYLVDVDKVAQ